MFWYTGTCIYKYQHLTIDRNYFTTFLNLGGFVFQELHQLPSCLLPLTPPNPSLQVTRSLEEKQDVYFVLNPITWTSCIESNNLDKTVLCWYQGNSGLYFLCLLVRDVIDLKKFVTFLMRQSWDNWNIKQISHIEVTVFQMKRLMFYEFKWCNGGIISGEIWDEQNNAKICHFKRH